MVNFILQHIIFFTVALALSKGKQQKEIFEMPEDLISFNTASLFALASYCAVLYRDGHKDYDCGYECSGESEGTILEKAYVAPKSKARFLISYNHRLKAIFFQSKGMQDVQEIKKGIQLVPSKLNNRKSSFGHESGIKLHSGFRKINEELRNVSMPALSQISRKYPDYKIVFVGHSLGGGIALLAAVDYYELYGNADRISVYSFGKPRIGNKAWAQYVNRLPFIERIFRMTRYGDPITLIPPKVMGYEQEGQAYQILPDETVIKCKNDPDSGESKDCSYPIWRYNQFNHSKYFELGHIYCDQEGLWQRYNVAW
jgi:hypothetical protein